MRLIYLLAESTAGYLIGSRPFCLFCLFFPSRLVSQTPGGGAQGDEGGGGQSGDGKKVGSAGEGPLMHGERAARVQGRDDPAATQPHALPEGPENRATQCQHGLHQNSPGDSGYCRLIVRSEIPCRRRVFLV